MLQRSILAVALLLTACSAAPSASPLRTLPSLPAHLETGHGYPFALSLVCGADTPFYFNGRDWKLTEATRVQNGTLFGTLYAVNEQEIKFIPELGAAVYYFRPSIGTGVCL